MSGSITPYAGESDARLTAQMNSDNASQLVAGQPYAPLRLHTDFEFGPPMAYSDTDGRNTEVAVNITRPEYQGTDYIQCTRQPLTILNALPQGYVDMVVLEKVPFKLSDILDKINSALGLNLVVSEIRDQLYSAVQPTYPLPIDATQSLAWIDSDFTFNAAMPLNLIVANTAMNGLFFVNGQTSQNTAPSTQTPPPFLGDFTKDPAQLMVDMINFCNAATHAALKTTDVVFGQPQANLNPSAAGNTQLLIDAATGTGYNGNQVITYNRQQVNIVTLVTGQDNVIPVGQATKISDLIPAINAKYGINLTEMEYTDGPLPAFANGVTSQLIQIPMLPTSLIWTGTLAIQITAAS